MTRLTLCRPRNRFFSVFAVLICGAVGCGGSRHLQSVSLSPASANAQDFPGGRVQFTATGTFSKPPSPVELTGNDIFWCIGSDTGLCVGNAQPGATVDQSGIAGCNQGFVGTVTVLAGKTSPMMMGNPDQGSQLQVFGTAKLTCP